MRNCQIVWQIEKYKNNSGVPLFGQSNQLLGIFQLFKLSN